MIKEFTVWNFPGFYESPLCPKFEPEEDYIRESCNDVRIAEEIISVYNNHIDYAKYNEAVGKGYAELYIETLYQRLKEIKFISAEIDNPQFYNFSTDKLHVKVELSENDMNILNEYAKDAAFAEKVKEEFTDRSGFTSFHSNDINEWPQDVRSGDYDNIKLGLLMNYVLNQIEQPRFPESSDHESEITEHVMELSEFHEFINYDALLKDVIGNFQAQGYSVSDDIQKLRYNDFVFKANIDETSKAIIINKELK